MSWGGRLVQRAHRLVVEVYGARCYWCSQPIDLTLRWPHPYSLSVEHLVPRSKGGTNHITNLRPAHLIENQSRGNSTDEAAPRRVRANPAVFPDGLVAQSGDSCRLSPQVTHKNGARKDQP